MGNEIIPIKSVEIRNFRCVYHETVELDWFTVLIGKNDTGKTSVLDSLALVADLHGQRSRRVEDAHELVSHGQFDATDAKLGHTLGVTITYADGAGLGVDDIGSPSADSLSVLRVKLPSGEWQQGGSAAWAMMMDGGGSRKTNESKVLQVQRRIADTPDAYRLNPARMREPAMTGVLKGAPLPSDGHGLVDALVRMPHSTYGKLLRDYCKRIPEVSEVLRESYAARGHIQEGTMEIRFRLKNGDEISARQASDGAMLVLGFLALIMDKNPPQLILIEEPENGVHPAQLQALIESLIDLSINQHRVQIVMTTHSPFVLDAVPAENIRVTTRTTNDGTKVHRFTGVADVKNKLGLGYSVGEAFVNMVDEVPEPVR